MKETGVDHDLEPPVSQKPTLRDGMADMAGLLFDEIALESLLQLVVSLARSTLDAADEASVSVVHAGIFETITATSPTVRDLDHVQYESGRGPCMAATRSGKLTSASFDDETGRWPEFSRAGLNQGFRGVLAIPLTAGNRRLGAVNLYSRTHATFLPADAAAAQVFADHAAVALANAVSFTNARVLNEGLTDALETRDAIGLARGILMNRDGCSATAATEVLRRESRRRNITLRELSEEIAAGQQDRPREPRR
jgi:GAF domain-containing protein